ncbi:hypothetical protein HG536_0C05900 [Torulaspora globosa]|uniref:Spore membrane assembly protein 2 n=1 Tax=Torulaspora globosa TaxID=48254 RepID=A0A7G3ZFY5_9SACH|nr:uncharacterized protein HG536_0C05900 [Torulaspora globosa]QLL32421.1 hypothetical protein HG536_0C05900 [Torulaspora globosa]
MFFLKRFLAWIILLIVALTQLLLYIPILSCRNTGSFCVEQFRFSITGSSAITEEFINSVKEVLKLISYLALDMGWSTGLTDSDVYREENLVDTFDSENVYSVNHFGYCKKKHSTILYCAHNGHSGMDVLGILVRDIGIQLGMLSMPHQNETTMVGESLVLTYHLGLTSLKKFLKAKQTSALSKVLLLEDGQAESGKISGASQFARGVALARFLQLANAGVLIMLINEISVSVLCMLAVLVYGITLVLKVKVRILITVLKAAASVLIGIATITFASTLLYFLALKTLEPSGDPLQPATKWDIMQLSVGPGFVIGWIRYALQIILLPLTFGTLRYYSTREEPSQVVEEPGSGQLKDWA